MLRFPDQPATSARVQYLESLLALRELCERSAGYLEGLVRLLEATGRPGHYGRVTDEVTGHLDAMLLLVAARLRLLAEADRVIDGGGKESR